MGTARLQEMLDPLCSACIFRTCAHVRVAPPPPDIKKMEKVRVPIFRGGRGGDSPPPPFEGVVVSQRKTLCMSILSAVMRSDTLLTCAGSPATSASWLHVRGKTDGQPPHAPHSPRPKMPCAHARFSLPPLDQNVKAGDILNVGPEEAWHSAASRRPWQPQGCFRNLGVPHWGYKGILLLGGLPFLGPLFS